MLNFVDGSPGLTELNAVALLLLPFLGAVVVSDLIDRSIPNLLIAVMLICGIAVHVAVQPDIGTALFFSLGGVAIGFLILVPFYALGGMGAGDVKLLAAVGSFIGPQGALLAGILTLGAGSILGLCVIAWRSLKMLELTRSSGTSWVRRFKGVELPYSIAIFAGTLVTVTLW